MAGTLQKQTITSNTASGVVRSVGTSNSGPLNFTVQPNGATCTLYTAIDSGSDIWLENPYYKNFTTTVQGQTLPAGKLGITISNIQAAGVVVETKEV